MNGRGNMKITQSKVGDFTAVSIEGEVDLNSSPQLRKAFSDLIDKGMSKIIINFSKVDYIDSSGLATLIEMRQRMSKDQGRICLVEMSDKIKSLFEITKLDKLFTIYRTQQEVVASA